MTDICDLLQLEKFLLDWPEGSFEGTPSDNIFARIQQVIKNSSGQTDISRNSDFAVLLRHILRRQSLQSKNTVQLSVPRLGWPSEEQWKMFGISVVSVQDSRFIIEAIPWYPSWMEKDDTPIFEDAFAERYVRKSAECPMDPFLMEATGFSTYTSPGQREAILSALFMPKGQTLIINLPTGMGKSLVGQAPTLVDGIEGGLTLFVVPTTALVLDQSRRFEQLLKERYRPNEIPITGWHAGLNESEKTTIKTAIREGRQGILFCSPEAATGSLQPSLYDAAKLGNLKYIVIDEAHLISSWGDEFRPAFQFLSGLRTGLLRESGFNLKTILMSATFNPETLETLYLLFGPTETIQMVSYVYLRPEPQYWIKSAISDDDQENKILETVRHSPRPFILYVTKREAAVKFNKLLSEFGFQRIAFFHAKITDSQKQKIIKDWASNNLDGVIATSAFGVGIDKSDVRTVIHATVPETLDRFYQEVGRGGRDGKTSGSFLIYTSSDLELAMRMGTPKLIGEELGFNRWNALFQSRHPNNNVETFDVKIDTVPVQTSQQSEENIKWNHRTILLLARSGLVTIGSKKPDLPRKFDNENEQEFKKRQDFFWNEYYNLINITITDPAHLNIDNFNQKNSKEYEKSINSGEKNKKLLNDLLRKKEISQLLASLYSNQKYQVYPSRVCGGCYFHRSQKQLLNSEVHIDYQLPVAKGIDNLRPFDLESWKNHFPWLMIYEPILISYKSDEYGQVLDKAIAYLVTELGIREIVVSNNFRTQRTKLSELHTKCSDPVLVLRSLETEKKYKSTMQLPRLTVIDNDVTEIDYSIYLNEIHRPLNVLLFPENLRDLQARERRLIDITRNSLNIDLFIERMKL